jgi:hypothetical protein
MSKIGSTTTIRSIGLAVGTLLIAAIPARADDPPIGRSVMQVLDVHREAVRSRSSIQGFRRTVRRAHAERSGYIQGGPSGPSRGPQQTCYYLGGGNSVSVPVCW